ncbi:MAG: hypothetical protein KAT35_04550 [Candidatus Aenigmarchaeota archaeon]|nr:hypothetical protein [Candidatus Aenigmarchaeota archaeon]
MKIAGLEAGTYLIEIRSGASFKPYHGKINLKPGRSITLERELNPEVEVEDLLLMGKMPRKKTDPKTALKSSFVPGLGMFYNGDKNIAPLIPIRIGFFTEYAYGRAPGIRWE